jgi:hypothetical protein
MPTRMHRLGPITRAVITQRRAGDLDPAANDPRVYRLLLRAAIQADRQAVSDWFRVPHQRPPTNGHRT